jgi:hypothetical protein
MIYLGVLLYGLNFTVFLNTCFSGRSAEGVVYLLLGFEFNMQSILLTALLNNPLTQCLVNDVIY